MSVLAIVALPSYSRFKERARVATAIAEITEISQKLEKYRMLNYAHPGSLTSIGFTREDPWGNAYLYLDLASYVDKTKGPKEKGKPRKDKLLKPLNTDYDLFSTGPDGDYKTPLSAKVSRDDIVRAYDGAFIGIADEL